MRAHWALSWRNPGPGSVVGTRDSDKRRRQEGFRQGRTRKETRKGDARALGVELAEVRVRGEERVDERRLLLPQALLFEPHVPAYVRGEGGREGGREGGWKRGRE